MVRDFGIAASLVLAIVMAVGAPVALLQKKHKEVNRAKWDRIHQEWCADMGYDFSYDTWFHLYVSDNLPIKPKCNH